MFPLLAAGSTPTKAAAAAFFLPVKGGRLHRRFARVAEFFFPPRVDLIGIFLESKEGALEFLMRLGVFDDAVGQAHIAVHASLPEHPCLLALAAGDCPLLGPILVSKGTTTSSQDNVGVAKVLKEGREAESIHAARDDGSSLDHAFPLLVVVGAIGLVLLQHVCDALVRRVALHLAKAHSANVDAAGSDDAGELSVHECRVSALRLGAGDGAMTSPVVVEELFGEVPACNGHSCAARNVSVDKEGAVLGQWTKLGKDVLAASNHLSRVICRDIG